MKTLESRVVVEGLVFPEGIRWHQGKVWFSDIHDYKVYTYDPGTNRTEVIVQTEDRPSGLGFLPDGKLLIASQGERTLLRLDRDGLKTVADLKPISEMLNDMVVDGMGRAYLDNYVTMTPRAGGNIVLVEVDGSYRVVAADGMKCPNGMAITPDGKTLVANDLYGNQILAFDIAQDGSLTNRRLFADLGTDSPDGLCLDAEGAAWCAFPFQGQCRRIRPGGEVTHQITYKDRWCLAAVLGGPDRRTLFLCTSDMTFEKIRWLRQNPRDPRKERRGWIEVVEGIDVPGAGWP